tara:strand:- start:467 stop:1123 length:657 start_codon:yes stop_codon:yes gene_type:complete
LLKANNISKSFNDKTRELSVLNNISLEVNSKDILTIYGSSGVGKSTLLSIMSGLLTPDKGTVFLNEYDLYSSKSNIRSQRIGYIFQSHCMLPEINIIDNLLIPAYINNLNIKKATNQIDEYLGMMGLQDVKKAFPVNLSYGENQRLSIIRSLVNNPLIIFADEPTGNLDENNSKIILELFVKLNVEYDCTFIVATHDNKFTSISSKCYKIDDRKLIKF